MTKLNQLIAIASGKKSNVDSVLTGIYHSLQKTEMLSGISKTYRPKDDEGEQLPSERKNVQVTARQALRSGREALEDLMNTTAELDATNCVAKADIKVDGNVLAKAVPVTHLLFLEKQLCNVHTLISKLPTLDPAENWSFDEATDTFRSEVHQSNRSKKVYRNHVKADATDKHPAQVEVYTEDVTVGYWDTVKFSGAVKASEKNAMLDRVRKLQDAVKFAREEANGVDVVSVKFAAPLLDFVFGK